MTTEHINSKPHRQNIKAAGVLGDEQYPLSRGYTLQVKAFALGNETRSIRVNHKTRTFC